MFDVATRFKFRFPTTRGMISAEDLWDLPLTSTTGAPNLNDVAKSINKAIVAQTEEVSFVETARKPNSDDGLKLEIVKHVIGVRQEDAKAAAKQRENKELEQKILAIMAERKDASLGDKSDAELRRMLTKLAA